MITDAIRETPETWRTATYSGHSGCVSVAVIEEPRRA